MGGSASVADTISFFLLAGFRTPAVSLRVIKREYGEAVIREAFRTAARRIRADELPDPDEVATTEGNTTEETGRHVPLINKPSKYLFNSEIPRLVLLHIGTGTKYPNLYSALLPS